MALSHRQRGTVSSYYGKINSHCLLTERPYFYFIICACCLDVVQVSCRRAFSPSRSEGCFTQRRAAGMAGSAPPSAWVPSASLRAPPPISVGGRKCWRPCGHPSPFCRRGGVAPSLPRPCTLVRPPDYFGHGEEEASVPEHHQVPRGSSSELILFLGRRREKREDTSDATVTVRPVLVSV